MTDSNIERLKNLPEKLKEWPHWTCYKLRHTNGRTEKIPLDPRTGRYASVSDRSTWSDFNTAFNAHRNGLGDGIGIMLGTEDESKE